MKKKSTEILQEKIDLLRMQQYDDIAGIKASVHNLQEHLRPSNLLKDTMKDLTGAGELPVTAVDTFISLGAGYFANLALAGKSKNAGVKLLGYLVQLGVTKYLADHLEGFREGLLRGWHRLRKDEPEQTGQTNPEPSN